MLLLKGDGNIKYYVYLTTNNINNKKYIGKRVSPVDIEKDTYLGSGVYLNKAIKEFGRINFSKVILCECTNFEELSDMEEFYIGKFNAIESDEFYNKGTGGLGGHFSTWDIDFQEEYRVKISGLVKGEKNPMFGKKHSKSSKESMSSSKTGKYRGVLNPMYGKKGEKALNSNKVFMYSSDGELIREFFTVGLALSFLNVKGHAQLYRACREGHEYKGYYWKKEERKKRVVKSSIGEV